MFQNILTIQNTRRSYTMQMKMVTSLLSAVLLLSGTNMMASQNGKQNGLLSNPTVRRVAVGAGAVAVGYVAYNALYGDKELDAKRRPEVVAAARENLNKAKDIEGVLDENLFAQSDVNNMHKAAALMNKTGHRQLQILKAKATARKATLKKIEHNFDELFAGEKALVEANMEEVNAKLQKADRAQQEKIARLEKALGIHPEAQMAAKAQAAPAPSSQKQEPAEHKDN